MTKQEKEIDRLKAENKENCWKCIEAKRVTEEDYAKLQEQFAQYQMASDKEMIAQIKQAKIDVLKAIIDGYGCCYISPVGNEKYKVWRVLKEIIDEVQNGK